MKKISHLIYQKPSASHEVFVNNRVEKLLLKKAKKEYRSSSDYNPRPVTIGVLSL